MIRFPDDTPFLRLPTPIDAERLRLELEELPSSAWAELDSPIHSSTRCVLLRGGDGGDAFTLATSNPVDSPWLAKLPYMAWLTSSEGPFGDAPYAYLFAVKAQSLSHPHSDISPVWKDLVRVHVPIVTHERSQLLIAGRAKNFQVGEAWSFDNKRKHALANRGPARVHLLIDVVPNPKLNALVEAGSWESGESEQRLWDLLLL